MPIPDEHKANRPFKVYLATGSSIRVHTARPWIDKLKSHGISVYDWTRDPNWDLGRMPTEAEFIESATRDEDAIVYCDAFWYIVPADKSEGAAAELAIAYCHGKPIVGSGDFGARNIFALRWIRPEMRFASEQRAFDAICAMAEKSKTWRGEF